MKRINRPSTAATSSPRRKRIGTKGVRSASAAGRVRSSPEQLLTVQSQLHKLLTGESLDQSEEYRCLDCLDESELENSIVFDAKEWIEIDRDPQDLIRHFGKGANSTLKYLRSNVPGWKEYEDDLEKEKLWYGLELEAEDPNVFFDPELQYKADELVADRLKIKQRELDDIKRLARKHFPGAFSRKDRWPTAWMNEPKALRTSLGTKRGQRFIALMNLLWDRKMSIHESRVLLPGLEKNKKPQGISHLRENIVRSRRRWILVHPDPKELSSLLGVDEQTVRLDLRSAVAVGALVKLAKRGPRTPFVYAIAYKSKPPAADGLAFNGRDVPFLSSECAPMLVDEFSRKR